MCIVLYLLGWGILLLNWAVDEDGDAGRGRVHLILRLRDAQLSQKVIEDLNGLCVLLGDLGIHDIG